MTREKLEHFLTKHDIDAEIIDTKVNTASVAASLRVLGLKKTEIVKSIVFSTDKGIVLAIVRGDQRISIKKLAKVIGTTKIQLADPHTVQEKTGYDVGGVPPIGHHNPEIQYLIDKQVLKKNRVYAGGGDNKTQLRIQVADLLKLVHPKVVSIAIS